MLLEALASVGDIDPSPLYEVIVVDNGSTDDTTDQVKSHFPGVRLIQLGKNVGVAAGRNIGVEHATGEIVIFIDDDAVLESKETLRIVIDRFDQNPDLAVVAFKIINDSANKVLSHEFPMRDYNPENIETEQLASYFIGCGFAARRTLFLEAGGFFPEMFYALEEVDLSYRLLDKGYDILYCPVIVVRHRTSPAVRRKATWYYNLMRSRVMLVLRNLPWWAAGPHLLVWHVGLLVHAARHGHLGGFIQGVIDGWRMAPQALATRRTISWATARQVWKLSGRLFY
ncbi:MAG: glycosyltransferase family 2 protein [Chloroflexi bacterium]|nr:glycosyltransferase family 2 protein [Chloroflexota bacterium]MCI0725291.1 glycosyltransferase family 2 protein [Chloroflexota bacterium]